VIADDERPDSRLFQLFLEMFVKNLRVKGLKHFLDKFNLPQIAGIRNSFFAGGRDREFRRFS